VSHRLNGKWHINVEWWHPKGKKETVASMGDQTEAIKEVHARRQMYGDSAKRVWMSKRRVS